MPADSDKTTRMDEEFATSVISPHGADETVQLPTREERIAAALDSSEPDLSGLDIPADLMLDDAPAMPAVDRPAGWADGMASTKTERMPAAVAADVQSLDAHQSSDAYVPAAASPVSYVAEPAGSSRRNKRPHKKHTLLIVIAVLLLALVLYMVFFNPYLLMNIEYLTWKNIGEPLSGPLADFAATAQRGALSWVNDIAVWVKSFF